MREGRRRRPRSGGEGGVSGPDELSPVEGDARDSRLRGGGEEGGVGEDGPDSLSLSVLSLLLRKKKKKTIP